ncbi:hypothetical protein DBR06_SOUSAS7810089, partial [Sousa chinensis]
LYWSHTQKFSQSSNSYCICSDWHHLIRKYNLNMCHQCFRQSMKDTGFIKLD